MIAIRREDLICEKRAPLAPRQVKQLCASGLSIVVQPCDRRIFTPPAYRQVGAHIEEAIDQTPIVLGLKEINLDQIVRDKVYLFFSHTIKGQKQNIPMLQQLLDQNCTLIDYECIVDDQGKRLVFFGYHAGLAGMLNTLWALGQRLKRDHHDTPFANVRLAHQYDGVPDALDQLSQIAHSLHKHGPASNRPRLVIGIVGTGNTSLGAQEILNALAIQQIRPADLTATTPGTYYVVFDIPDFIRAKAGPLVVEDYLADPKGHRSFFSRHLPQIDVLVNCTYWDKRYPRLVTLETLANLYVQTALKKPVVIGDISCDRCGAIEATVQFTTPEQPTFVYDVDTHTAQPGVDGNGPVIMAIYNLPAQLPKESTVAFGEALMPYIPALARIDLSQPFEQSGLPPVLNRATIVYRGELTPRYRYLAKYLSAVEQD